MGRPSLPLEEIRGSRAELRRPLRSRSQLLREAELKRRREKFYRIGHIAKMDPGKPRIAFTGTLPI